MKTPTHEHWMDKALNLARVAEQQGEVPIGAVLVAADKIIGQGYNQPIQSNDPTAHAEILALRQAARTQLNYRLPHTTLYVTLEPCMMCCGALIHARVTQVVFATRDPKLGCLSQNKLAPFQDKLNHSLDWYEGIYRQEAQCLLQQFFKSRRRATNCCPVSS